MNVDGSTLSERLAFDNRFRFAVSCVAFVMAALLSSVGKMAAFPTVALIIFLYSVPYVVLWFFFDDWKSPRAAFYVLSAIDFAAITAIVRLTGGLSSPFFYMYPLPFLVHAFHFDVGLIVFDSFLAIACYAWLFVLEAGMPQRLSICLGQFVFLSTVVAAAIATSLRFRKRERRAEQSLRVLQTTVQFFQHINSLSPALSQDALQKELLKQISALLKPLGIFSRLWIVNGAWKTLQGIGEHPAMRPGTPQHLPTVACPAFALRRRFQYHQASSDPCPSEQFNYAKHVCVPVLKDSECLGVLFLGSYQGEAWSAQETHLFEMLSHSIALILQRKSIFESLQDKVSELRFSFEVGATGLSTFVGSTQSIDETTINILDGVMSILKADRASLMIWDRESRRLQTQWARGGEFKVQSPMRLAMGEGMAGWALQMGEPYWAEYAMGDPHYVPSGQPMKSLVCVPIYAMDGQPLGVINALTEKETRVFSEREIQFLKWFSRQAALGIENAQLHLRSRHNIDQLNEVNQMKSQFLSLVSHDLRGPLTGVRGFCELLKVRTLGPLTSEQEELVGQLERQVDLQERMVDDLLDFARIEKGKLSILPRRTDVVELIREETEKSQAEARERQIALNLQIAPGAAIPELVVDGDRIRQVLWNMIHNALKFTPEGGRVTVACGVENDRLRVDISDTGLGLSPEIKEKVFEKFFQLSPGGSKSAQGLGLGLAICKEIVGAHRGEILASSAGLGQGTTFTFFLPLDGADADAEAAPLAA